MRRIKKANVKFLSLCKRGVNRLPCLFKASDTDAGTGTLELSCLHKFDALRGELLFVAYAPEMRDAEGDIASAEVIKEMAYSHARNGRRLDVRHDLDTLKPDDAFVAESFIVQKGDSRFADWKDDADRPVNATGSWGGVVKIESPDLRAKYASGEWNGVSLYAPEALVEVGKSDDFAAALAARLNGENMDLEKLAAALAKNNELLIAGLAKALAPVSAPGPAAPAGPANDGAPVFSGDPTNAADLEKHLKAVERHQLLRSGELADPVKLAARLAALKAAAPGTTEPTADDLKKQLADAETAKQALQAKLAKAQGGSNVPDVNANLSKEDRERAASKVAGLKLAEEMNTLRGFPAAAVAAK